MNFGYAMTSCVEVGETFTEHLSPFERQHIGLATTATNCSFFTKDIPTLKTPTSIKTSLLCKCASAVPVFETQPTGYLYSLFLKGTRGLFSLSGAGLVHCSSCCQSAVQEESIMCDLHSGPELHCPALKERRESEKKKKQPWSWLYVCHSLL